MAATIEVNKQSVKQLLETGKKQKFVIPEYQRSYAWTDEQIQILFDDLVEYTENDNENTYFLGTIVAYENDQGEQEIIDGQQRITSLFLLLRAFYTKLESMVETPESKNFKSQIETALWEQDELTAVVDYKKTLIVSRVMGDEGNKIFTNILTTGRTNPKAKDNYSINYNLFLELIETYAASQPEQFYYLIRNVLSRAILLPITADSQDTALTIFSTLNDRGLALSDADIFKAKMYNHKDKAARIQFIEDWQHLDEEANNANESIQTLFYYYMFYLRALDGDRKTTTPGLRKYYSRNNFEKLYKDDVMDKLNAILNLWILINNRIEIEGEEWYKNIEIKQVMDSLTSYPNEYWKYPVVTYYLKYRKENNFEVDFLNFLKKLFAILAARYVVTPTLNAVKGGILNLNTEVIKSSNPKFEFAKIDEQELKDKIKKAHRNTVRMILKVLAYQHQDNLLPEKWEIEHILPQKWQSNYFSSSTDEEVKELVEHIGNKVPFEKKLNITASNGYFKKKQESYNKSHIKLIIELSRNNNEWGLDKIHERDVRTADEIFQLFSEWGLNQINVNEKGKNLIVIPDESLNKYHEYIEIFDLEDNNENRKDFLNKINPK